jgi:hypothetical protein
MGQEQSNSQSAFLGKGWKTEQIDMDYIKPISSLTLPSLYKGETTIPNHPVELLNMDTFGKEQGFYSTGLRYEFNCMDMLDKAVPAILVKMENREIAKLVDAITWANTGNIEFENKNFGENIVEIVIDNLKKNSLNATAIGNIAYIAIMSPNEISRIKANGLIETLRLEAIKMESSNLDFPFV